MRKILIIMVLLTLLLTAVLAPANGADFTNIDRLKALVSNDLAFINAYTSNRERLVKESQESGKQGAAVPLAAEVTEGILDIQLEFERLDNKTVEAKRASPTLAPASSDIQVLEREWKYLHKESSIYRASLGSTPITNNAKVLIQFRISYGDDEKPAEGWRIGSVSYLKVPSDKDQRERQIDAGCKPHEPPFIRSTTTSTIYTTDRPKKKRAFLEQQLPPGQKYFWVQDDDCTDRSSPATLEHIQLVYAGDCVPFDPVFGGCYPLNIKAPLEKPNSRKKK